MRFSPFILILAGFIVWAAAFLLLYGLQATGCRLGWDQVALGPTSGLRWLLGAIVVSALALLSWLYWFGRRTLPMKAMSSDILPQIATAAHVAAIVSTLVTYSGVFWLTLC